MFNCKTLSFRFLTMQMPPADSRLLSDPQNLLGKLIVLVISSIHNNFGPRFRSCVILSTAVKAP